MAVFSDRIVSDLWWAQLWRSFMALAQSVAPTLRALGVRERGAFDVIVDFIGDF